ncbi:Chondroitin sulfate ABC exolyase precursor [Limihaloglobus sulfuriphilus]|uniref:Chondroitin sulfate ABC exolyase n=1 Tax=Limihaloglobus sulfuriphilus TaxID=1851148 RepID=A0A1Q2MEB8_9BACT|nr:chondroitinase family polysaccharide lyase [Limihaloglobus sulfuriphilus]AQQ71053.1 Chondroitin sulfate ABC exolyase precursor [Limihaloglobus sulfuriphilus]
MTAYVNFKKTFIALCFVLAVFAGTSAAYFIQPDSPFDGVESFEAGNVPSNWQLRSQNGKLSVTDHRSKHGDKSLKWRWEKFDAVRVDSLHRIEAACKSSNGGFKIWIYNTEQIDDAIRFQFKTKSRRSIRPADFDLNFTGWRVLWVSFRDDLGLKSGEVISELQILAPRRHSSGVLYFDIVDFTDYIHWDASNDYQYRHPGKVETATWDAYEWSKVEPEFELPEQISKSQRDDFEKIAQRYEKWVLGTGKYKGNQIYSKRLEATQSYIRNGIEEFDKYNIKRHEDGRITGTGLFASRSPYVPNFFHTSLGEKTFLALALDYKLNGSTESRDKLMLLYDFFNDQGWAEGSGLGTMNHISNRISSWVHSVFLMRDELKAAGKLNRELEAIEWFTVFREIFVKQPLKDTTTADALRTKSMHRLLRILAMEDSPQKVQYMQCYVNWFNQALAVTPGWSGTIKNDYLGYHHRGVYANAYCPNAFHMSSIVTHFLGGTEFAISDQAYRNLKNALLTQEIIMNKYHTPAAFNGRLMNAETGNEMIAAYAYMAMAKEPVDKDMAGVFMRLWQPRSQYLQNVFAHGGTGISYFYPVGDIELMLDFADKGIQKSNAPSGFWSKPYGALAVHRRDEWMVSVKGWSRYVWNYEGRPGQNAYGRYLSYGSMQILGSGDPVDFISSGYNLQNGWDWNRWPNATTIHLPIDKLQHRDDAKTVDKTGKIYVGNTKRRFTDRTFVGAVESQGRNGVWAMDFHDTVFDLSFSARKSVFFCDDLIVCLGSDIENTDKEYPTETTISQTWMSSQDDSIIINARPVKEFPYSFESQGKSPVWFTDPVGNGYVVADAENLRIERASQKSRDDRNTSDTHGDYTVSWIDHGKAPKGGEYEYLIVVQPGKAITVKKYADKLPYTVIEKNKQAHVLEFEEAGLRGYAVFDSQYDFAGDEILEKVSTPVLMAVSGSAEDVITLSVCDPDFRRAHLSGITDIDQSNVFDEGKTQDNYIELKGRWSAAALPANAEIFRYTKDSTVLKVTSVEAETYELKLIKAD